MPPMSVLKQMQVRNWVSAPVATYEGNLVPFSGGLAYEENPTILYTPVMGEKYLRSLVSPVPLELALMTLRSMSFRSNAFILLVNRVNDLQNPDFLEGAEFQSKSAL